MPSRSRAYVPGTLVSGQHLGPVRDPRHRPADANRTPSKTVPVCLRTRQGGTTRANRRRGVEEDIGPMGAVPHDVCEQYNSN